MQKLVFTNGNGLEIDLTSGNFGITNWAGLSNTSLNIQTQQVPFEDGGVFLDALMEQREIELTVAIYDGNNLELRYQKKRELISALNPKAGEGVLVYTNDYLTRQIRAVPQLPIFENKNSNDSGTLKASVVFSCPSPYWEDVEETVVPLRRGVEVKINNNGDVPTQIKVDVAGSVTNPSIRNLIEKEIIKLNGTYDDGFEINTNLGEKSIKKTVKKWEWVSGGEIEDVATNGEINVYVGDFIITEDINGVFNFVYEPNYQLISIVYANNKFVAVGLYGVICTSTDGINWTEISFGGTSESIIYANNLFIKVGVAGQISTSADGITWESQTSGISTDLSDVCYANNKFVAVGSNGVILTSADGITWESQTSGTSSYIQSIVYGNNKFVAGTQGNTILTSADGITWESNLSEFENIMEIIVVDNIFYAISYYTSSILTSTDGINWEGSSGLGSGYGSNVRYNNNLIVAFYQRNIVVSADGEEWNVKLTQLINNIFTMVFFDDKYIVGGNNGIFISYDKENWERVFYGDVIKIIKAKDSLLALTQGDGYGLYVYTSTDGITWRKYPAIAPNPDGCYFSSVVYSQELDLFVAVGRDRENMGIIYTSADGMSWTEQTIGEVNALLDIVYANGKFVAVGSNGVILTSADGITWENYSYSSTRDIVEITYGKNMFVALFDYGGIVLTSTDGITWTLKETGVAELQRETSICYAEDMFVICGYGGKVYSSIDGENWIPQINNLTRDLFSVDYIDNHFMAVGRNGIIQSYDIKQVVNYINNVTTDSDMNLNLKQGNNVVRLNYDSGNATAILKYRQKYIGV